MIKVFASEANKRLTYTLELLLGLENGQWVYTANPSDADIAYTPAQINTSIAWIKNTGVLSSSESKDFEPLYSLAARIASGEVEKFGDFDFVAFSFHVLTRMEEYGEHVWDDHGRYRYQDSLLYKHNLLNVPIIDMLADKILKTNNLANTSKIYTLDVDVAYKYKARNWIKNFGLNARDTFQLKLKQRIERWKVLTGRKVDPFQANLEDFIDQFQSHNFIFWLVSQNSEYDRQVNPASRAHKKLMVAAANAANLGLHASYEAAFDRTLLLEEKKTMELVLEKPIRDCRFHYIRLRFPESYQNLIRTGLYHDWSMGFPDYNGYRAGTAKDFVWYDLEADEETRLLVTPFTSMDITDTPIYPEGRKIPVYHSFNAIKTQNN